MRETSLSIFITSSRMAFLSRVRMPPSSLLTVSASSSGVSA